MKFKISFLLTLFVCLNSSLFAFNNKYFSVKDNGWKVEKKSDKIISFLLKDYTAPEEDKLGIAPFININIEEKENTIYVVKFNQKELDDLKKELENKAYKENLELAQKGTRKFLESNFRNATKSQIDKATEQAYEDSGIKSGSISKVGNSKAYRVDYKIAELLFRRFVVVSLNRFTIIEFAYPETFDLDSSKEYKDFISSFKNYDKDPSSFNGFIYGNIGRQLFRLIIIVVVGAVITVVKKLQGGY